MTVTRLNVTGFGKNGLIAGLVKTDFFQKRHLLSSSTAYAKYERFTKLCFNATTLNSRSFAMIAFLMFEENAFRVVARRGLSISVYYSIAVYELTGDIVSATKTPFSLSVSSGGYVFSTKNLQAVNEESSCQQ